LDDGSAREIAADGRSGDPLAWPGYPDSRASVPGDEAVRVWHGSVDGRDCVLIAFDFAHLGGSMGAGVGERVARGFAEATKRRLPVITVAATGGARMQEGMVALAQMPRTVVAARVHAQAGLLQIGVASDPTTGGVYASFLSQADVLIAEPNAYVAFAGPRVVASLGGYALQEGANRAEFAFEHGLIDAVVARPDLRDWLRTALIATSPAGCVDTAGRHDEPAHLRVVDQPRARPATAWDAVTAARARYRPRASAYAARLTPSVRLHGDRHGGTDPGVVAALGCLRGRAVGFVGLDRHAVQPAGYRTAWRVLDLADRLGHPLLTVVDTPGADSALPAEAAGQAAAIGATFGRLLGVRSPTVALVTGEGGSGGALALCATDRVLIQRGAIFSVIAPEGAAAILHRDVERAPQMAELLRLTADDLMALGIADAVADDDPDSALDAVVAMLDELSALPANERVAARLDRWGRIGTATVRPSSDHG
jgi:acyl-CoA carboxylase subunit beta